MNSFERVFVGILALIIGSITVGVGLWYHDWQVGLMVVISGFLTIATGLYTIGNSKTWAKADPGW